MNDFQYLFEKAKQREELKKRKKANFLEKQVSDLFKDLKISESAHAKMIDYSRLLKELTQDITSKGLECTGYLARPKGFEEDVVLDAFLANKQEVTPVHAVETDSSTNDEINEKGYTKMGVWHSHADLGFTSPSNEDLDAIKLKTLDSPLYKPFIDELGPTEFALEEKNGKALSILRLPDTPWKYFEFEPKDYSSPVLKSVPFEFKYTYSMIVNNNEKIDSKMALGVAAWSNEDNDYRLFTDNMVDKDQKKNYRVKILENFPINTVSGMNKSYRRLDLAKELMEKVIYNGKHINEFEKVRQRYDDLRLKLEKESPKFSDDVIKLEDHKEIKLPEPSMTQNLEKRVSELEREKITFEDRAIKTVFELKKAIDDYENRLYSKKLEIQSLKDQISELKRKNEDLEQKVANYMTEESKTIPKPEAAVEEIEKEREEKIDLDIEKTSSHITKPEKARIPYSRRIKKYIGKTLRPFAAGIAAFAIMAALYVGVNNSKRINDIEKANSTYVVTPDQGNLNKSGHFLADYSTDSDDSKESMYTVSEGESLTVIAQNRLSQKNIKHREIYDLVKKIQDYNQMDAGKGDIMIIKEGKKVYKGEPGFGKGDGLVDIIHPGQKIKIPP